MAPPQPVWGDEFVLPTGIPEAVENETIRQIVRLSLGGRRVRIVISNAYGEGPLEIGSASVAVAADGSAVEPTTLRKVTFGGDTSFSVPPGAPLISDPVDLVVDDLSHLAVSLYLPHRTPLTTFHWDGRQTGYLVDDNATDRNRLNSPRTTTARLFLTRVLVETPNRGSVIVIGDSITDGNGATVDADTRWTDFLADKLLEQRMAVLNAGISGGRLLQDNMGDNALARFGRDVLQRPGARAAILLLGINDISWPGTEFAPKAELPKTETMIAGYRQLVQRARVHDVRIVGATLLPFAGALEGTPIAGYYSREKDEIRGEVNNWIRTGDAFDAVLDFDSVLRDPRRPS